LVAAAPSPAQEQPRALKTAHVTELARRAAEGVDDSSLRRYRSDCDRRSRLRFNCRVRWNTGAGRYAGRITIWRTGTRIDYRDHYATSIRQREAFCERRCVTTHRDRGLFVEDTRRARFGQGLTLLGQEGELLRVTPQRIIDPVPLAEYEEPPPAGRYLGVELALLNVGERRVDESLRNDTRLVLADGRTVEPGYPRHPSCSVGDANVPAGDLRLACVAFAVSPGDRLQAVEVTLNSGFGPETGLWNF
jgi:hypothetical protein